MPQTMRHDKPMTEREQEIWDYAALHPQQSDAEIGAVLGISRKTVADNLNNFRRHAPPGIYAQRQEESRTAAADKNALEPMPLEPEPPSERRQKKILVEINSKQLSERFTEIVYRTQDEILAKLQDPDEVYTLKELGVIAGIATDKRAILRGEPTQIIENRDIGRAKDVAKQLFKLLESRGEIEVTDFTSEPAE